MVRVRVRVTVMVRVRVRVMVRVTVRVMVMVMVRRQRASLTDRLPIQSQRWRRDLSRIPPTKNSHERTTYVGTLPVPGGGGGGGRSSGSRGWCLLAAVWTPRFSS